MLHAASLPPLSPHGLAQWGRRPSASPAEGFSGISDVDHDSAHREAMLGGEAARDISREGWCRGSGRFGEVLRIGGGKEERDEAGAE